MFGMMDFFATNHCIKEIIMVGCHLENEGLRILSQGLKDNSSLKMLDLRNNSISNEGAKHLAEAMEEGKTKLRILNLHRNRIADSGAKKLAHAIRNFQNN